MACVRQYKSGAGWRGAVLSMALLLLPPVASAQALSAFFSDGCSLFPDGTASDGQRWCECCLEHDKAYWQGGTAQERRRADLALKTCVLEKSGSAELAGAVYFGVTLGGSPYFPTWYRWGYGWPYGRGYQALSAQERQQATAELQLYSEAAKAAVCATSPMEVSDLAQDETVVFFDTLAFPAQDRDIWVVPIHGWVYEPANSVFRKGAFAAVLKQKYGLVATPQTQANFDQRVNLFLADNERRKHMVIRLGAQRYAMAPSEPNGHFYSELRLDQSTVAALSKDHTLAFSLLLDAESQRSFAGRVRIADDTGIAVISDIDDTVKVTQVTDHKKMLENTFFNDFVAVQGMAQLYRAWAAQGASIHFVTSSPWQLYLPLKDFLAREHFPPATFSMKYFRFFDSTFFDIFKSGGETKPAQIEPILRALPGYRFILVGDSGEQDPQVYAALAKQNPEKIARIYIRKVESSPERDYRAVFSGIPDDKWRLFSSAAELRSLPFP